MDEKLRQGVFKILEEGLIYREFMNSLSDLGVSFDREFDYLDIALDLMGVPREETKRVSDRGEILSCRDPYYYDWEDVSLPSEILEFVRKVKKRLAKDLTS